MLLFQLQQKWYLEVGVIKERYEWENFTFLITVRITSTTFYGLLENYMEMLYLKHHFHPGVICFKNIGVH